MNHRFIKNFVWYYGLRPLPRSISYVISGILYPLVFLFLIIIFSAGKYIDYAVIGGFISIVAMNAIYSGTDATIYRLQMKIQDLFVATPITSFDYMIAICLSYLSMSLPGIAVYSIIGLYLGIFNAVNASIFVFLLIATLLGAMAISFTIFGFINRARSIWGISQIVSLLLAVLPPIFYPYFLLPKALLYAFMISPVTEVAMLSQGLFGLAPIKFYAIPILIIETIIYLFIGTKLIRWMEK